MARQPNPTPPAADLPVLDDTEVRNDLVAADQVSPAQRMVIQASHALQAAGRLQAMQFVATVADRAIAETYISIKESNAYKNIPYLDADGNLRQINTLDEYCQVFMPKSYRRCEEVAANLHLLGPALYDQAEALGIRQKDYNAIKALPADDQALIKQAMSEAKSRDEVLDILQEMAVKHKAEKEALGKVAADTRADYEAAQTVSKKKQARIDELEREVALIAHLTPDEMAEELRLKAVSLAGMAEAAVLAIGPALEALRKHRDEHPGTDAPILAGLLANVEAAIIGLREEYGLTESPDADTRPEWVKAHEAGRLG